MKLLTLNSHSLQEKDHLGKMKCFVALVTRTQPDVVALQEVNQTMTAAELEEDGLEGMVPVPGNVIPVRRDNYAAEVVRRLRDAGMRYSWSWLPVKVGYGRYDEGIALFSLGRNIVQVDSFRISGCCGYHNWKTRKVLGVRVDGRADWFYTVHMGWWGDEKEPFRAQWERLNTELSGKKGLGPVWLLGDFNSPAEVRGEGYDCIRASGWLDTYLLAEQRDSGITVKGVIDGWRDKLENPMNAAGMRIDHIWCSRPKGILRSSVRFDGEKEPQVSDHCGVLVETRE